MTKMIMNTTVMDHGDDNEDDGDDHEHDDENIDGGDGAKSLPFCHL